jgi:hypothetical protein
MQKHSASHVPTSLSSRMSRRHVMQAAAGGAVLLSSKATSIASAASGTPVPVSTALYVRQNVHQLPEGSSVLEAYAQGIATMKERPVTDPTSWVFQARIHGAPFDVEIPQDVFWNQCPHNSKFFLPWHRMYLYWFERIVRKASGNLSFALPYWDYSQSSQQVVPAQFRSPAEESNALYVAARNATVNAGEPPVIELDVPSIPRIATTIAELLAPAFALLQEDPFFMSTVLETIPHGLVHVWVGGGSRGGPPGWMASTATAALDPLFWLHHANIDRLWKRWLDQGGNRRYPTEDADWMNRVFNFYDEDGHIVQMTGADVLETVDQLNYGYDDDPPEAPGEATPVTVTPAASTPGSRRVASGATPSVASTSSSEGPMVVGAEGTTVAFPEMTAAGDSGARRGAGEAPPPARIDLHGVTGTGVPAVLYLVFMNLPPGQPPDPASPYYVGAVNLFGLQPWDSVSESHDHASIVQSIDISRNIAQLQARGEWQGEVNLTLVPVDFSMPGPVSEHVAGTPQASPAAGGSGAREVAPPIPDNGAPWVFIEGITITN